MMMIKSRPCFHHHHQAAFFLFALIIGMIPQQVHASLSSILQLIPRVEGLLSWNPVTSVRNLNCVIRFLALSLGYFLTDSFDGMFQEDSIMRLAQAGTYQGIDNIYEYDGFMRAKDSKYWASGPAPLGQTLRMKGVDENSMCQLSVAFATRYQADPAATGRTDTVRLASMVNYSFDVQQNYVKTANIFFAPAFFEYFFGTLTASAPTRDFICNEILGGVCQGKVDAPVNCDADLAALMSTEGDQKYFDGNTMGCRVLHAGFALDNPTNHCAHVALARTADPQGNFKCQESDNIGVDSLFSDADMDLYSRFCDRIGLDPAEGYEVLSLD